jgi:hypothetical protein
VPFEHIDESGLKREDAGRALRFENVRIGVNDGDGATLKVDVAPKESVYLRPPHPGTDRQAKDYQVVSRKFARRGGDQAANVQFGAVKRVSLALG